MASTAFTVFSAATILRIAAPADIVVSGAPASSLVTVKLGSGSTTCMTTGEGQCLAHFTSVLASAGKISASYVGFAGKKVTTKSSGSIYAPLVIVPKLKKGKSFTIKVSSARAGGKMTTSLIGTGIRCSGKAVVAANGTTSIIVKRGPAKTGNATLNVYLDRVLVASATVRVR
jgi:hypothetical protein